MVRWCWVNFQCLFSINLDYSRARAYCACSRCGWGLFRHFFLIYHFSLLSPSFWEMVRYRLKYYLKGPLSPNNQPTNNQKLGKENDRVAPPKIEPFNVIHTQSSLDISNSNILKYSLIRCILFGHTIFLYI